MSIKEEFGDRVRAEGEAMFRERLGIQQFTRDGELATKAFVAGVQWGHEFMLRLGQWATRHHISEAALIDLIDSEAIPEKGKGGMRAELFLRQVGLR